MQEKKESLIVALKNWCKKKGMKENGIIPANVAYCKTTYGAVTNIDNLINEHRHKINKLIEEKIQFVTNGDRFSDYRCIYSFPKDVKPYIEKILSIFLEKGYNIVNLSEKVEELKDENVYMLSWFKENL